jgi:hypothetical protein
MDSRTRIATSLLSVPADKIRSSNTRCIAIRPWAQVVSACMSMSLPVRPTTRRRSAPQTRWHLAPGSLNCIGRWSLAVVLTGALSVGAVILQAQAASAGIFSAYVAEDYQRFGLQLAELSSTDDGGFRDFERQAKAWLSDGAQSGRALVAAAVALEFAHALRDQSPVVGGRYVHWAARLLRDRQTDPPTDAERVAYLACLSTALELGDPWTLVVGERNGPRALVTLADDLGEGGLLGAAQRRFPNEQHFDLVAATYLEIRNVNIEPVPELLELAERNIKTTVPLEPRSSAENTLVDIHWSAAKILGSVASAARIRALFARLENVPSIGAEVALHQAVLDMRGRRFTEAATEFQRVADRSGDSHILFLAEHFLGRTEHYRGRGEAAIAAFERSLKVFPLARSSVTWLSALLMATDSIANHDRAIELMANAYRSTPAPDPLRLYARGEARHRAAYMILLRQKFQ